MTDKELLERIIKEFDKISDKADGTNYNFVLQVIKGLATIKVLLEVAGKR